MRVLNYLPHRLYHWWGYPDNKTYVLRYYVTDDFGDAIEAIDESFDIAFSWISEAIMEAYDADVICAR